MLNREEQANPITDNQEDDICDTVEEIAVNEPTLGKVNAAIKGLQNGKLTP